MEYITFCENGIYMVFSISEKHCLSLLYFSALPYGGLEFKDLDYRKFNPVELVVSEAESFEDYNKKSITDFLRHYGLRYRYHTDTRNPTGRKVEFITANEEKALEVTLHFQFYNNISAVRCWSEVYNGGGWTRVLKYVSSLYLHWPKSYKVKSIDEKLQLCLHTHCMKNGMGILVNRDTTEGLCCRIGDNSLWRWEFGECGETFYLKAGGPDPYSGWQRNLAPDESFISIPVTVTVKPGGLNYAVDELLRVER